MNTDILQSIGLKIQIYKVLTFNVIFTNIESAERHSDFKHMVCLKFQFPLKRKCVSSSVHISLQIATPIRLSMQN